MSQDKEISLKQLLERIDHCKPEELGEIYMTLQRRYSALFPDWEIVLLTMPGGSPENRREQGYRLIEFIQKHLIDT